MSIPDGLLTIYFVQYWLSKPESCVCSAKISSTPFRLSLTFNPNIYIWFFPPISVCILLQYEFPLKQIIRSIATSTTTTLYYIFRVIYIFHIYIYISFLNAIWADQFNSYYCHLTFILLDMFMCVISLQ